MAETFSTKGTGISNVTHILNKEYGYPKAASNPADAGNHPNIVEDTVAPNTILTPPIVTIPSAYVGYNIPTAEELSYELDLEVGNASSTLVSPSEPTFEGTGSTEYVLVQVNNTEPDGTFQIGVTITGMEGPVNLYDSWPTIGEAIANAKAPGMFTYGGSDATASTINKYACTYYDIAVGKFYHMYVDNNFGGQGQATTIQDPTGTGAVWNDVFQATNSNRVYFVSEYTGTGDGTHRVSADISDGGIAGRMTYLDMSLAFAGCNLGMYYSGDEMIPMPGFTVQWLVDQSIYGLQFTAELVPEDAYIKFTSIELKVDGSWYDMFVTDGMDSGPFVRYHFHSGSYINIHQISFDTLTYDENTEIEGVRVNFTSYPRQS